MASRKNGLERKDALLDAALDCFVSRGVHATGIEAVRKAAGASPSSVYHLFGGVNDLVVALLERTSERWVAHLTKRVIATKTGAEAIAALVDGHLEWVLAHRKEARFLYQAMALELAGSERQRLVAFKKKLKEPLFEYLSGFAKRGELPAWSTATLELVVLGPAHEACRRLLAGGDVDVAWMRRALPHLAWKAVCET
jgi:AcrR family transcriptional regulator